MTPTRSDINTRNIDLSILLDGISSGQVTLPAFQRGFGWSDGEIVSLVATVLFDWPAGSLLLMRGQPQFFDTREFAGLETESALPDYVVLDGQQRLTALHRAFRGSGPSVFALDVDALEKAEESAEELEGAVNVVSRAEWSETEERNTSEGRLLVPLFALTSAADYFEWRDALVSRLPLNDREGASARLSYAYKALLGTVNHYEFPSVVLEHDLPTEAVARIFERINRGGLRLSTFDLLVARAYTPTWNLRDEWESARDDSDVLELYLGEEGLPIAQSLALRAIGDIRRPAIIDLKREIIHDEWEPSVRAMEDAVQFVMGSGMRNPSWLPYPTLLIPLAALARDFELEEHRDLLDSWLWARSFQMEYDVASSTKIASDFTALTEALGGTGPIEYRVDIDTLLGATRRGRAALWRAFLSLLLRRGAVDLPTGEPLVLAPGEAGAVSVTSLFPGRGTDEEAPHLQILGFVLMHRRRGQKHALTQFLVRGAEPKPEEGGRLATQFLEPSSEPPFARPNAVMSRRLQAVRSYVEAEFPHIQLRAADEEGAGTQGEVE